jgi:hypothetical protein
MVLLSDCAIPEPCVKHRIDARIESEKGWKETISWMKRLCDKRRFAETKTPGAKTHYVLPQYTRHLSISYLQNKEIKDSPHGMKRSDPDHHNVSNAGIEASRGCPANTSRGRRPVCNAGKETLVADIDIVLEQ